MWLLNILKTMNCVIILKFDDYKNIHITYKMDSYTRWKIETDSLWLEIIESLNEEKIVSE